MADPFKVFAITELGFDANTDFTKLRNFYYHFFEDEIFMAMPDEVKEVRMRKMEKSLKTALDMALDDLLKDFK